MNLLVKRFIAIGATSVIAVTGTYLIDPWEGNKNQAYIDMVGIATVCRGETKGVKLGDYRTDEQCDKSTVEELTKYNTAVNKAVMAEMKPYEEVAYTSLAWNIGTAGFANSTLVKKLNSGDHEGACKAILDWNKATFSSRGAQSQIRAGETCTVKKDGNFSCTVKGLTNRRVEEYNTCLGNNQKVNAALEALDTAEKAVQELEIVDEGVDVVVPDLNVSEPSMPTIVEQEDTTVLPECKLSLFGYCLWKK